MDAYVNAMNSLGDFLIKLFDPNGDFTGYTKVRKIERK